MRCINLRLTYLLMDKLEWWSYQTMKKFEDMFSYTDNM